MRPTLPLIHGPLRAHRRDFQLVPQVEVGGEGSAGKSGDDTFFGPAPGAETAPAVAPAGRTASPGASGRPAEDVAAAKTTAAEDVDAERARAWTLAARAKARSDRSLRRRQVAAAAPRACAPPFPPPKRVRFLMVGRRRESPGHSSSGPVSYILIFFFSHDEPGRVCGSFFFFQGEARPPRTHRIASMAPQQVPNCAH